MKLREHTATASATAFCLCSLCTGLCVCALLFASLLESSVDECECAERVEFEPSSCSTSSGAAAEY